MPHLSTAYFSAIIKRNHGFSNYPGVPGCECMGYILSRFLFSVRKLEELVIHFYFTEVLVYDELEI